MNAALSKFINSASSRHAQGGNGILYIEDFDLGQQQSPEVAAPTPPPSFSEDEVSAAREAGRQTGLAEAREERASVIADLQLAAVQSIADAALQARLQSERRAEQRAGELSSTMLAVLAAALPAAMSAQAEGEIQAIIEALLPAMRCEPVISLRAHPEQLEFIEHLMGEALKSTKTVLTVHADATLELGSVFFEWRDGGAIRDCGAIWKQITKALEPLQMKNPKDIENGC